MKKTKIILRRKNEDTEGDKYQHLLFCTKQGIEMTTPFKEKATVFNEGEEIRVACSDWKAIHI